MTEFHYYENLNVTQFSVLLVTMKKLEHFSDRKSSHNLLTQ
jgi:hypothetical protein